MRYATFPVGTALFLVAGGCFSGYRAGKSVGSEVRVHRGTFRRDIVLTGELEAARGATIAVPDLPTFQTSVRWLIADGADVKAGDRVVELDSSAFTSQSDSKRQAETQAAQELQQREAEWRADLEQKKLDVEKRHEEWEKARLLASIPRDLVAGRDYAERQTKLQRTSLEHAKAVEVYRAQKSGVAADRANLVLKLEQARREVAVSAKAVDSLVLRAPRDGIVVLREHPWESRKLQAGDPVYVSLPLAMIPDLPSLQVAAFLADVDDGKAAVGMRASVTLDSYPGEQYDAVVASIAAVAQESQRASVRRAFKMVVKLDRVDSKMRPGLSARVVVHRDSRADALLVSRGAVDFGNARPAVRLARDGKRVALHLGPCNAQDCVVIDGVEEGTAVEALVTGGGGTAAGGKGGRKA